MFTPDWFPHLLYLTLIGPDSSSGRTSASGAGGRRFETRPRHRLIIVLKTNYFVCFLYSLNTNRIRGVLNVQGAHAIFFFFFFFETLKCARINDTSRVIRNPNILHMRKQRRRCCNRAADQRLCFCYIDTVFPLLPKSEIISASSDLLWLYSPVCVGPGWIPPNTGFGRKFVSS